MFGEEDTVKRKGNEKTFCTNDGKGINLNTNDINDDVKGCNESTIKRSIILMKWKLCFRIIAKLENSNRQHYSQQDSKKPTKKKKRRKEFIFTYELQEHFLCLGS